MCGIVGYIGEKNCVPILINGLKRLEYRGYDSAGIGIINNGNSEVVKNKGKVSVLEDNVNKLHLRGIKSISNTCQWKKLGKNL